MARPRIIIEDAAGMVKIRVLGSEYEVPCDTSVLRAFQHLAKIRAFTEFCWNGDCMNCKIDYRTPKGAPRHGLACSVPVQEGMQVTKVYSPFIKFQT
jgi:NADH dehydrogenase/NADH:ubiquinone oxidoreductase subunit G